MMLGVLSLSVLALFYLGVYRPTHSPFSGWWTLALICAAAASVLLLANDTSWQVVLNPASSAVSAIGATCVWFATRSLGARRSPVWLLAIPPVACVIAALPDHPSSNIWAGNGVLFAFMAAGFGMGAYEVWRAWALRRREPDARESGEAITALAVSAIAGTMLAVLYTARLALYLGVGHEDVLFTEVVGSGTASVISVGVPGCCDVLRVRDWLGPAHARSAPPSVGRRPHWAPWTHGLLRACTRGACEVWRPQGASRVARHRGHRQLQANQRRVRPPSRRPHAHGVRAGGPRHLAIVRRYRSPWRGRVRIRVREPREAGRTWLASKRFGGASRRRPMTRGTSCPP